MISLGLACVALFASTIAAPSQTSSLSVEPFDDSVTKLPASFTGTNLAPIHRAVSMIDTTKDEFETWDEFRTRVDSVLRRTKFSDTANGSSTFATTLSYVPQYNAEARSFSLSPFSWLIFNKLVFGDKRHSCRSSFSGRTVDVMKKLSDYSRPSEPFFGLAFPEEQDNIVLSYPCDPATARSLKDDISVLAVFILMAPSSHTYDLDVRGFYRGINNFNLISPIDDHVVKSGPTNFSVKALSVVLSELWIYKFSSGEVLRKVPVKQWRPF